MDRLTFVSAPFFPLKAEKEWWQARQVPDNPGTRGREASQPHSSGGLQVN